MMALSNRVLLVSVAAGGLAVGAVISWTVAWWVAPRYWKPVPITSAQLDETRHRQCRVYEKLGLHLISLEPRIAELYVLSHTPVGLTSKSYFWIVSNWSAVAKDREGDWVDMAGPKVESPPDLSLLCPADRRTGRMQRNVIGQLLGFGIEVSRGEITRCEIARFARNV
jgi:hypothetical protein